MADDDGLSPAGSIRIPGSSSSQASNYTFSMDSDDGSQLYIDGVLVIDDAGTAVSGSHAWSCRHEASVHVFTSVGSSPRVVCTPSVLVCVPIRQCAVSDACCKC